MPDDSISDEEFNNIMAQMETGASNQRQSSESTDRRSEQRSPDSSRNLFGNDRSSQSSWERQMEDKIEELDARRDQDSDRGSSRGGSETRDRGRSNSGGTRQRGQNKLDKAINMVVENLKDKGYTDDFISNNREMIRNKVKDYMREDQPWF